MTLVVSIKSSPWVVRCLLDDKLAEDLQRVEDARARLEEIALRVTVLEQARDAFERFEHTEGWRREDLTRLQDRLDDHWADVLTACVQADDPSRLWDRRLRHARATTAERLEQLDASIPADRAKEWQQARRQLPGLHAARHHAEQSAANSQEPV